MECPICFEIIKNNCVTTCNHEYCYNCLTKWIMKGKLNCPLCKSFIYKININNKTLYEFESLYYNKPIPTNIIKKNHIIDFNNSNNSNNNTLSPGLTVSSNDNYGIKIVKLNKKNRFYKEGFRNNDIILFLNNIPCIKHNYSMSISEDKRDHIATLN